MSAVVLPRREASTARRERRAGSAWRDTLVLTRRNLLRVVRSPQQLFFQAVQPIIFVLLFRYVFGGSIAPAGFEGRYVDYLLPGVLVQATLFAGAGTSFSLAEDLSRGIVDRFRSLPISRAAVLSARVLTDLVRTVFTTALTLGVGYLVGFRVHNGLVPFLGALGLVLAFAFAFLWVYALIGLLVQEVETVEIVALMPIFPLTFASSAFVPTDSMPGWLQAFARNQPVTHLTDAVRSLTQGVRPPTTVDATRPVLWSLAWIAAIVVVFVPLCVARYRRAR
jgi:ABC transporter DrrB family efflux protein